MADSPKEGSTGQRTPAVTPLSGRRVGQPGWGVPRPLALGLVLTTVSVCSAFLLSPGLSGQQVPDLTPEDIGRPFRAPSVAGFKAGRDFEVADEAHTAARREEARLHVRPVFDYDEGVEARVNRSLREAFVAMREVIASRPSLSLKKPVDGRPHDDTELLEAMRASRRLFEERAQLPDNEEDFDALALARFSPEVEAAALSLVEVGYRSRVVASREELSRMDSNGITVRVVGVGTAEYPLVTTPPSVLDLREVALELDRYASVPGNVLPDAPMPLRRAVLKLARKQVRVNLTVNIAETEARRQSAADAVKPVLLSIKKGQRIIGDGELINESHLLVTKSLRSQMTELDLVELKLGGTGLVALVLSGAWLFFSASLRRFRPGRRDAAFMGLLALSLLSALHVWVLIADAVHDRYPAVPIEAMHFAFPVAAGAMLVRFVLTEEAALFFAIVFSSLAGLMLGNSLGFFLFSLVTSLVASDRIARVKDRAGLLRAGVTTGGIAVGLVAFLGLAAGKGLGVESVWAGSLALLAASLAVPMLVLTLTPLVEAVFGYASDLKLLELANLNHPALKELVLQAPGTYHHSIIMGSLVEAAAESIGANPLLARSCAYYHDIGKGRNPGSFGENQKGENPHDSMAPAMSAAIIKRHVSEGLEMAREYKLPRRVADAIPQHHGTRLVGYFFHKAQREIEGKDAAVDEAVFRYPGPKPQSRETALVMIADACEAASRSMPEASTDKLRALVQKMINVIFSEGQLDECDLTLKDLNLIAESFTRTLEGIYHGRPSYPAGAVGGGKPPTAEVVKMLTVVKGGDETKRAAP